MTENSLTKILLVDDEPDILTFIGYNLKKEGYQIYYASNGAEAIEMVKKEHPHLVLLDIMMPEMDGIETCREIRETENIKDTYIAFLTARKEDYSQIAAFEVGADDFINKPISPRVLLSRIKALLSRKDKIQPLENNDKNTNKNKQNSIFIDRESYRVTLNNEHLDLRKKEFELLSFLSSKPGKVFSREELLNRVWGNEIVVNQRTVDVHISKLREKLGDQYIKTIKGVGYKFEF